MSRKILIDLSICRSCPDCRVECRYSYHPVNNGMKDLLERALFQVTCRKCEDAPCMAACPSEALERNAQGVIERSVMLCIGCKSCVVACPFGTLMTHMFDFKKPVCDVCRLDDAAVSLKCQETCPKGAIRLVDMEENAAENIYRINDRLLVKELTWEKLKGGC